MRKRTYLGVTISTKEELWKIREIPLFCHVGSRQNYPHARNRLRVDFLAKQRNEAMKNALSQYPDTTHIVNIESKYLDQTQSIIRLIGQYDRLDGEVILGASTWAKMQDRFPTYYQFYDGWATPELYYYRYHFRPPRGLVQVSSVGSCLVFPVWVWRQYGFRTPEPFPDAGIYYNWLCQKSHLPVLLDLDIRFYRDCHNSDIVPCYPPINRLKATFWKPIRRRLVPTLKLRKRIAA